MKIILIFVVVGAIAIIGSILGGTLWLAPIVKDITEVSCTVTGCDAYIDTCRRSSSSNSNGNSHTTTYTCYRSELNYNATIDGRTYVSGDTDTYSSESEAWGRCNKYPIGTVMTCYYNADKPADTLTSSKSDYYGGAIALTVVLALFGIICCAVGIGCYIKSRGINFGFSDDDTF